MQAAEEDLGSDGYADSSGVKIHYVTKGTGPVVIMIHGFPDFWYSWRNQIPALAEHFQVVAIDQRGYNLSDQPEGVENYAIDKLVADVDAVRQHLKAEKISVVGHDWGGLVAWMYAIGHPQETERLVICNLPHPQGLNRELATNEQQQKNSQYARNFQQPDAATKLNPQALAAAVSLKYPAAVPKYVEAFSRSSMEGMLNYYKANYPREPYTEADLKLPKVVCPVLMFHGLGDWALLPGALNGTWNWLDKELTLITIPKAGHWVQHDAAEVVTRNMLWWLQNH